MLPFITTRYCPLASSNLVAAYSKIRFIRAYGSWNPPPSLRHRDWGVAGHLSRPTSLSEEEPDEEDDVKKKKKVRYQTDNYAPKSNPTPSRWSHHRTSMKAKFPQGWAPPHKLSRAAMDGLRALHAHDPDTFTTPVLADKFRVSPEAVRRILRGKWQPTPEQHARLLERERRHRQDRIRSKSVAEPSGATTGDNLKWRRRGA